MRNVFVAGMLALAAAKAAAQENDIIKFNDPKQPDAECEILTASYKSVVYDLITGGTRAKQTANARDIREIVIAQERRGFDYPTGEDAMNRGDYPTAIDRFERAKKDTGGRTPDIIKQMAAIGIVKSHYYAGNTAAALASIRTLRQEKPESFFLRESYEIEYQCHQAKGDVASMNQVISAIEEKGKADAIPDWVKSADLMRASLHELQRKWPEALAIYRKHARDRDVGEKALLGELRCQRETGDWSGLKGRADAIIAEHKGKKGGAERLLMAAHNGLGEIHLNAGRNKEALLEFFHGVGILNRGGETSREHETSIARAAMACARFAAASKDKTVKDEYVKRAKELQAALDRAYAGSSYRAEVQKSIADVK